MQNITLYVNRDRDTNLSATKEVISLLKEYGKNITVDQALKDDLASDCVCYKGGAEMFAGCDLIVALGGDGTILKIVAEASKYDIPVMGINLGHLGFLTQAERHDLSGLRKMLEGEFSVEKRMMLEARVVRNGEILERHSVLNDIIIRSDSTKMISLEAEINQTEVNKYLADGIIIATSTGSTAYSLSCGGPIVHKALDCMIMTPICPHTLKSRCIIVPSDASVVVRFDPTYCNEVDLKADGISKRRLSADEYVEIVRSEKRAPLVNIDSRNYFDIIREKLSD